MVFSSRGAQVLEQASKSRELLFAPAISSELGSVDGSGTSLQCSGGRVPRFGATSTQCKYSPYCADYDGDVTVKFCFDEPDDRCVCPPNMIWDQAEPKLEWRKCIPRGCCKDRTACGPRGPWDLTSLFVNMIKTNYKYHIKDGVSKAELYRLLLFKGNTFSGSGGEC